MLCSYPEIGVSYLKYDVNLELHNLICRLHKFCHYRLEREKNKQKRQIEMIPPIASTVKRVGGHRGKETRLHMCNRKAKGFMWCASHP